MGIGPAIVQNKQLTSTDHNVIFSFTIYVGIFFAVLFALLSPLISFFYHEPMLLNMSRILSLNIFVACINIVPNSLLYRDKQFKIVMFRELFAQIISGSLGIATAFYHWGVYALLVQSISNAVIVFLINYYRNPLKICSLQKSSIQKIAHFSIYQFSFDFINYFSRNLDNLLIGKYLSTSALGFYEKSYRLMLLPLQYLTHVLSPTLQPFFSDFQQDKKKIFDLYSKIIRLLALIGFPLTVFLHFTAKELILIIFGEQWVESIPIFSILSWCVGLQIVNSSSGSIYQSANDTKRLFISGFLSALTIISAICLGLFYFKSLEGVAYCLVGAFLLIFFINYYILISFTLNQSFYSFLQLLYWPIITAGIVYFGELILSEYINMSSIFFSLTLKAIIAFVLVLPVAVWMFKKNINN